MAQQLNSYAYSDEADIILRSSSNVDFYVIGAFVRYVSPVFKDMFASSRSDNNEKKDNLPVVPVAEDSETLRLLLDFIYPYEEEPQLSNPTVAWQVSKATQKYMMNMIENKLKRSIARSNLISEQPLRMYAIAINLGWEEVAINAARCTLAISLQELAYVDELQHITGAGFYRFLEYRRLCGESENPSEEVLPLPSRHKVSFGTCTKSFTTRLYTPHSDQIEDLLFATAPEPYTRSELSDLILRTSDDVDFYVSATLIRLSSPFFNQKFPLENPVTRGGLAVIEVQEDSNVLYLLLGFIYPAQEPNISDAEKYVQLVLATRKYEMAHVENRVEKHATASSLVTVEPLRMYAVASALGWTRLAKTTALNTLHTPFQLLSYGDEINLMTGTQLFCLMRFRFACADAACDALNTRALENYGFGKWLRYYRRGAGHEGLDMNVPGPLREYLKVCPRGSVATDVYYQELLEGLGEARDDDWINMPATTFFKILIWMRRTPEVIEEAVSQVQFLYGLWG